MRFHDWSGAFVVLGAASALAMAPGCDVEDMGAKGPVVSKYGDGGYYYPPDSGYYYPPDSGYYYPPDSGYYYPPDSGYYYPPDSGYYYPPDSGYYYPDSGSYYPPDSGYYYPPDSGYYYPPDSGYYYPPDSGSYYPPDSGYYYPPDSGSYYPPDSGYYYPPDSGSYYPPDSGYYYPDAGIVDAGWGDASVCTSDGGCDDCAFLGPVGTGPASEDMMMSLGWEPGIDDSLSAEATWCSQWTVTRNETISGTVGLDFKIVGVGFSTKVTTAWTGTEKEEYKLCNDEGPPCQDQNGTRRVVRESTLTCIRECSKTITLTGSGQITLFGSGGSAATDEQLKQSNNVTETVTVPAGTPVSNLAGMCTAKLDTLEGSSFEELCDATDRDFEANLEWRYTGTDCGSAEDPDGWCEGLSTLPSVDAWTDSRCLVGGGPEANSYYTYCKLYSVPQGNCSGSCSSGMFEYPCAPGLVCVRAPESDVDCGCGLFQDACIYHCVNDGSGTYDGPGAGQG